MVDNSHKNKDISERIKDIRAQRKLNRQSEAYKSPTADALKKARDDVSELEEAHSEIRKASTWMSPSFWVEILRTEVADTGPVVKELIGKKKLKAAKEKLKEAEKKDKVARKIFDLTGSLPGEKSGVIKNEEKANKIVKDHLHKIKISAAKLLAYGKDDELKENVMKEIKEKYPEIVKDINTLAKKARERANNNEFKKTTSGLKFAQNQSNEDR